MNVSKKPLKTEEKNKREQLKREKPYVYEKIVRYDEKVKNGESIAKSFTKIVPASPKFCSR